MSNVKSVVAGLAISVALAGGIVSLGSVATAATTTAATAVTAGAGFTTWGDGDRERDCDRRHHGGGTNNTNNNNNA
jgi:hypothetical protein